MAGMHEIQCTQAAQDQPWAAFIQCRPELGVLAARTEVEDLSCAAFRSDNIMVMGFHGGISVTLRSVVLENWAGQIRHPPVLLRVDSICDHCVPNLAHQVSRLLKQVRGRCSHAMYGDCSSCTGQGFLFVALLLQHRAL